MRNPVSDAPIAFSGIRVSSWGEVSYETYFDYGIDTTNGTFDLGKEMVASLGAIMELMMIHQRRIGEPIMMIMML